ncbi:MarR family winged helix-turn-helix transcriptional regulator [Kitasatospora sp. NPDC057015]|uniref:MarR family winged helix-turn-helix transcriptional regulator n=1 Tax=Kitasatospora sp. NPDC057015 TaxID=3346001 RepID=UPI0036272B37
MYDGRKGSSNPSQQTVHLLTAAGRAAELRVTQRLADQGLSRAHLALLSALAEFGPHAKPDLAARVGLAVPDALPVLDDLLATGLIESFHVQIEHRREVVTVNRAGREALERLQTEAAAVQDELLAPLTRGERAQLNALLRRVCAAADRTERARTAPAADAAAVTAGAAGGRRARAATGGRGARAGVGKPDAPAPQ